MDRRTPETLKKTLSDGAGGARGDAGAARAERAERRLAMLGELAAIGMRLAREVERQVLGESSAGDGAKAKLIPGPEAEPVPGPEAEPVPSTEAEPVRDAPSSERVGLARPNADLGLVFSRISRAVRQTLALQARLDAEAEVEELRVSQAQKNRMAARERESRKQKDRVRRHIEEAIAANDDGRDAEGLLLELDERLEDPDYGDELGGRPIGVIVARICDALGVDVDLRHFTDAELDYRYVPPDSRREAGLGAEPGQLGSPGGGSSGGGFAGENSHDRAIANDTGLVPVAVRRIDSG